MPIGGAQGKVKSMRSLPRRSQMCLSKGSDAVATAAAVESMESFAGIQSCCPFAVQSCQIDRASAKAKLLRQMDVVKSRRGSVIASSAINQT